MKGTCTEVSGDSVPASAHMAFGDLRPPPRHIDIVCQNFLQGGFKQGAKYSAFYGSLWVVSYAGRLSMNLSMGPSMQMSLKMKLTSPPCDCFGALPLLFH